MIWKRPSFWATLVTLVAYGLDIDTLYGSFVYDDAGSVSRNVVVNGQVPWTQVWERDFWGTSLQEPASHKSFRPVTTLSFRLNWLWATKNNTNTNVDSTLGFHLVNVLLHGLVVFLVTEAAAFVFDGNSQGDLVAQLATGLLFGLHPVHVEAVSNITSRGEVLMSLFMLLAFLSYANQVHDNNKKQRKEETQKETTASWTERIRSNIAIFVLPWAFTTLSLFSKEQGATTLITLVAYDFIHNVGSIQEFFSSFGADGEKQNRALGVLRPAVVLALQTLCMCGLRMRLNGETSPDFITDQNPAGFAKDRFTRIFSINWVYCLYIWDAIYPRYLCCDWSGSSIPLIEDAHDVRIVTVLLLWVFVGWCCYLLLFPSVSFSTIRPTTRRIVLVSFFAFLASPFLLSSNLLVVVGLMKADRVIYLPLLGLCLLEALVFKTLFCRTDASTDKAKTTNETPKPKIETNVKGCGCHWLGYLLLMTQLVWFTRILHERNIAWSSNLDLWMSAYEVNPTSYHTMYNCGYELSLKGRYYEAEMVMRPIGSARVNGPSNSFVYAMALFNLNRKQEARAIAEEALTVIEEQRQEYKRENDNKGEKKRFRPELLARTESNLMVAKALTMDDLREAGQWMYKAVETDPRNEYAIQQAQAAMKKLQAMNML